VRKLCVDRDFESGGQLVVVWDTLTHMRKLNTCFLVLMVTEKKITAKIKLEILIIIHKLGAPWKNLLKTVFGLNH